MTTPKYTPAAAEKRVFDYSAITRFIEAEADKRMVSKWTLLGGALTRAALATPHTWLLPAIVEDVGGLNLLIVHAGPSGSGKGAGKAEIFSWPDTDVLDLEDGHQRLADVFVPITVASGEAFGSLFVETQQLPDPAGGKGKIPVSVRIRYAAWADFDEVDQEVLEVTNPIAENDKMMVNEAAEGKFGQLAGADLTGYQTAVDVMLQQASAVSGLPGHYLGLNTSVPASADAIRAAEAALTARAEARQAVFGRAWEQVARLILAVENGGEVTDYAPRVRWADPATRSAAQEADAVTKLHAAGIITTEEARERLGIEPTAAGPTPVPTQTVTGDAA